MLTSAGPVTPIACAALVTAFGSELFVIVGPAVLLSPPPPSVVDAVEVGGATPLVGAAVETVGRFEAVVAIWAIWGALGDDGDDGDDADEPEDPGEPLATLCPV